jgi:predicted anti-sigma-YlaC factor YlaD
MMFADFETELSPTDQNDLLQHLQTCESCRRHYDLTLRENEVLMDTSNILPSMQVLTARYWPNSGSIDQWADTAQATQ